MVKNRILSNAREKIRYFNKIGIHYEAVYHYVIRRRCVTKKLYDSDFLDDITAGLISFDMQRMMGSDKYMIEGHNAWAQQLKKAIEPFRKDLNPLRSLKLQSVELSNYKDHIIKIFDGISEKGLNQIEGKTKRRFPVGTSKILHFLIPELFIIVDSNSKQELGRFHRFSHRKMIDGQAYFEAMKCYQKELKQWATDDPKFPRLIGYDNDWRKFGGKWPTPLPRIIDKCTFVGDKWLN